MAWLAVLLVMLLDSTVGAFKILTLYPTPSLSHQIPPMSLVEGLVKKGHEVFFVSPNSVPGLGLGNYTYVDLSFSYKYFSNQEEENSVDLEKHISRWEFVEVFVPFAAVPEKQFTSEPFLQFQKRVQDEKIKFDVAILETFSVPYTCAMTRMLSSGTPLISMTTIPVDFYGERNLGSFQHLSYIPSIFDGYPQKMNMWQKIDNWFLHHFIVPQMMTGVELRAKNFYRETYGEGSEALVDGCWRNVSLSMISSNPLYFYPRLLGPNIIEFGPVHLKPPGKLPKNLQAWMDGADKGVIYFSLGSNMKSKSLPEVVRANFLKFFRELPSGYRVLWKWEEEGRIHGQSENILAQKWFPQHSVLAHPKVRVFITQGGLQSFQEAVHYGVPLVAIPWYGDQNTIAAKIMDAEIGVRVLPHKLTSYEIIESAVNSVLFDQRYARNMKKLSAISHDFTSQALDTAIFWVEHVARHGGASYLRPATADTTYFQFFCLDIISVILGLSCVVLYILKLICKFLISILFRNARSKVKIS